MRGRLPLFLALLALLPTAAAAPAVAELRVAVPLDLAGDVALEAREGVALLPPLHELAGGAALVNITLLPVDHRAPGTTDHEGPLEPLLGAPLRLPALDTVGSEARGPVYLEMEAPQALTFTLWQAGARAVLAVGPFDEGRLALRGAAAAIDEARAGDAGVLPDLFAGPDDARALRARGPGDLAAEGTVRGLFEGVGFLVANATAVLQVDATRGGDEAYVAVVRWSGARLAAQPGAEAVELLAPRLQLRLDGGFGTPAAWGGVRIDDEAHAQAPQGRPLRAEGAMEGTLLPGGGTVRVRMTGDLASLALGDERQDFARAAAAGAGLALLSALAYYGQHLRFLAVPLYARIAPSDLLDNEVRRRVHAHVAANPGADVKGTAEAVQVSWSTAAYHLARLEREAVLLSRRAGRSKRFFLNGGQHSAKAEAIGALRNPTTLAIAQLVARSPGIMQKDIGADLGLPPSTVSWHMRRLRALGVVREERRWRSAAYAPGALWDELASAVRAAAPLVPATAPTAPPAGAGAPPA